MSRSSKPTMRDGARTAEAVTTWQSAVRGPVCVPIEWKPCESDPEEQPQVSEIPTVLLHFLHAAVATAAA